LEGSKERFQVIIAYEILQGKKILAFAIASYAVMGGDRTGLLKSKIIRKIFFGQRLDFDKI
jgi:hypothetical protein